MFTQLSSLKRWHWLVISILIGIALATIATPKAIDLRTEYGDARNSQKDFENALVREIEGRRRFKNIVVHRQSVPNPAGGDRNVWIVSGLYCSNVPEAGDGKLHWKPSFFVADEPYRPANDLSIFLGHVSEANISKFEKVPNPTVLDFLQLLGETSAVKYSHAWWRSYAAQLWFVGSLAMIGIVWPTAIDLIVFGRLIRPREEKGTDLKPSPTVHKPAKQELTADDRAKLQALDDAMEANLKAGATAHASPAPAAVATPVKQLGSEALVAVPAAPQAPRAYGAGAGDFYPTEQKSKSKSKSKPKS